MVKVRHLQVVFSGIIYPLEMKTGGLKGRLSQSIICRIPVDTVIEAGWSIKEE
jgi:hypothetical protein